MLPVFIKHERVNLFSLSFQKSDIMANNRKLLYEGVCGYKNARGKTVEVVAVLLNDVFFFLQDNNQKYSFFAQDSKVS